MKSCLHIPCKCCQPLFGIDSNGTYHSDLFRKHRTNALHSLPPSQSIQRSIFYSNLRIQCNHYNRRTISCCTHNIPSKGSHYKLYWCRRGSHNQCEVCNPHTLLRCNHRTEPSPRMLCNNSARTCDRSAAAYCHLHRCIHSSNTGHIRCTSNLEFQALPHLS